MGITAFKGLGNYLGNSVSRLELSPTTDYILEEPWVHVDSIIMQRIKKKLSYDQEVHYKRRSCLTRVMQRTQCEVVLLLVTPFCEACMLLRDELVNVFSSCIPNLSMTIWQRNAGRCTYSCMLIRASILEMLLV